MLKPSGRRFRLAPMSSPRTATSPQHKSGTSARKAVAERPTPESPARNPVRTVDDIIKIATEEFAQKGLSGARIDEIAARMSTSKRTIYYHFGSKEALYLAVLEASYRRMREGESSLQLAHLAPIPALQKLVAFTFEFHFANADFVRLVMNENIHQGQYVERINEAVKLNAPAIATLQDIYTRGVAAKVFRAGLDAVDLHMSISALCFYYVSNRYTFSHNFAFDMTSSAALARRRDSVVEMVLRHVQR